MISPLAVRRLLASVTLAIFGAGIGAAGAAGSEPPEAPSSVPATDSSITTTTLLTTTTTTGPTTTTIDRGAQRRWSEALRDDVAALVAAVSSVAAASDVAEAATVREMFDRAAEESLRLHERLDVVASAAQRLERHLPRAARLGLDTAEHRKVASAARIWEQAQRRAAEPYPCRGVLPPGAGEWTPRRLGDFQPYVDCLASEVAPLAEEVAAAGQQLTEAVAALD